MPRYIDADEAIRLYAHYEKWHSYDAFDLEPILNEMPTADVAEVKRGRWKIKAINTFYMAYGATGYEPVYECSLCGAVEESYLRLDEPIMPEDADFPRYCPNCGALMMDEVEE